MPGANPGRREAIDSMSNTNNTQAVDIFELTCHKCSHVSRIINDGAQELDAKWCPKCGEMIPCDNGAVVAEILASLTIDVDTFEVIETIRYTKAPITESDL